MLVLLHFYRLGYSPFTLAFLFLLYEAMGVVANLIGGWLATRYGITRMLTVGLSTQITGFLLLSALSPTWTAALSVAWVVLAQGICGVAKDLTKTASKSAIKLTAGEAVGPAVQVGGLLHRQQERDEGRRLLPRRRAAAGARLPAVAVDHGRAAGAGARRRGRFVPPLMGKSKAIEVGAASCSPRTAASTCWRPRAWCCSARATSGSSSACRCSSTPSGWTFTMVGGFLALWTIGYGLVQAVAPALVRAQRRRPERRRCPPRGCGRRCWPCADRPGSARGPASVPDLEWVVVAGLAVFGFAFAVNSSVHSYLILAYAGSEKAAEDVGFYYAANALGRFCGTLLSGLLYQWGGITACLAGSAAMLIACFLVTLPLPTTAAKAKS